MNKKLISAMIIAGVLFNNVSVFAQDLPKLSTPKLDGLQTPTMSTSFSNLRNNMNNEGNLPDLPKLQSLPTLDLSTFETNKTDYSKGIEDLKDDGYGKKVEIINPTLSASNKTTLFDGINKIVNDEKQKLTKDILPENEINSKLKEFENLAKSTYSNSLNSNESSVSSHVSSGKATLSEGQSAFKKALSNTLSLDNLSYPSTSVPSWHYKPSSQILEGRASVDAKSNSIKNGDVPQVSEVEVGGLSRSLSTYSPDENQSIVSSFMAETQKGLKEAQVRTALGQENGIINKIFDKLSGADKTKMNRALEEMDKGKSLDDIRDYLK